MRVCIIGNGLTSLTLAKGLVNLNINVDLLEQKKAKVYNLSRTIGISKSNVEYFNNNILNIEKILWKLTKIEIFSENLKNKKLLKFENNNDELFSIVKNYKLDEVLKNNLSKNKYFRMIKFKKNLPSFENYNLIVNTDYFSPLTKKYFNKKITKKYNSFAYTTIIQHEKIKNNTAIQIFTKKGPLAFLPISNFETSVVFSLYGFDNSIVSDISGLIQKYNFKYKIKKIKKIDSFELKSLNLRSYYHKNILSFGDMLHKIHPLAGQGFNMTIRDIKTLTDIIKNKFDLGLPIDSSVGSEFEKKSKHKNFIFSNSIDMLHEFFNLERKSRGNILTKSVQILGRNQYINKIFTKIADEGIIF